jgi:hypothetical protein
MRAQQLEECVLEVRASIRRSLTMMNPTVGEGQTELCQYDLY